MSNLTVGSLFTGIGGLDLGLERAGMQVRWQCEINPFCRRVLHKHWPDIRIYEDILDIDGTAERVNVIAGGFPCQNISSANVRTRTGLSGESSSLWYEFERVIGILRPRWVIAENSAAGWEYWVPEVRSRLASLGYTSTPLELAAGSVGAPHIRKRVFLVANSDEDGQSIGVLHEKTQELQEAPGSLRKDWGEAPSGGFRVDDGVPGGLDRLRAVGNAVVPQVAEVIGRLVVA